MSSGCAPSASKDIGRPGGTLRRKGIIPRSPAGRYRHRRDDRRIARLADDHAIGRADRARPLLVPDHPGTVSSFVHLFKLYAFLNSIRRRPVAFVAVGENAA